METERWVDKEERRCVFGVVGVGEKTHGDSSNGE